jgi:hypothetical protein
MKKVHMYTIEKGVSCGKKIWNDEHTVHIATTVTPSMVTCKACLKKIASEKVWVGKKDMFSTGYVLRIVQNTNSKWEIVLYTHGYKVGSLKSQSGNGEYSTKGKAISVANHVKDNILDSPWNFHIITD